jgi:anti-anti-sigma factor
MPPFTVQTEFQGNVCIVRSQGYLDENGGAAIRKAVEEGFPRGVVNFVLNFAGSPVINSQGIAQLIEMTEIVIDEKKGKLGYVGLNELTHGVFKMVGLLKMGKAYSEESVAVKDL